MGDFSHRWDVEHFQPRITQSFAVDKPGLLANSLLKALVVVRVYEGRRDAEAGQGRITSYNVCYTKLLRFPGLSHTFVPLVCCQVTTKPAQNGSSSGSTVITLCP